MVVFTGACWKRNRCAHQSLQFTLLYLQFNSRARDARVARFYFGATLSAGCFVVCFRPAGANPPDWRLREPTGERGNTDRALPSLVGRWCGCCAAGSLAITFSSPLLYLLCLSARTSGRPTSQYCSPGQPDEPAGLARDSQQPKRGATLLVADTGAAGGQRAGALMNSIQWSADERLAVVGWSIGRLRCTSSPGLTFALAHGRRRKLSPGKSAPAHLGSGARVRV